MQCLGGTEYLRMPSVDSSIQLTFAVMDKLRRDKPEAVVRAPTKGNSSLSTPSLLCIVYRRSISTFPSSVLHHHILLTLVLGHSFIPGMKCSWHMVPDCSV
ncbi:uncharacterized protein LOC111256831 [Setaria italica]|uniref:uncharacterized protein LOC111256831 n=1 Tax=Setaria italica TaxID=4555 RepID=UPI000BE5C47A|nr:uncharacterized protein LOC111256831 [Setaria italica]